MHKKLLLSIIALGCAFSLKAQTQKGDQLLGGNITFSTNKGTTTYYGQNLSGSSDNKSTMFGIGPGYSYFIADNLDLGVNLGYSYVKQTSTPVTNLVSPTEQINRSTYGMIYLRKYLLYKEKVGFRFGPFASYSYIKNDITYSNNSIGIMPDYQKGHTIQAGGLLEFVYFPTKHLGLASTIGSVTYNHQNVKQSYAENKLSGFSVNFINSLSLNIFYASANRFIDIYWMD